MKIKGEIDASGEARIVFSLSNMGWGTPELNVPALLEMREVVSDLLAEMIEEAVPA